MTGFLFGLGMVIAVAQIPSLLGVRAGEGNFFPQLWDLLGELDTVHTTTLAVGAGSLAVLILGPRLIKWLPSTLLVLVLAIAVSALAGLEGHGVDVVGQIPDALPDPAIPDIAAGDLIDLIVPALGVLVLSAEGVGVARGLAVELADALRRDGIELRLALVRAPALEVLTRSGLAERLPIAPTLDSAVRGQVADA